MNIVFAASEAAPFIKTGGLADVAGALPAALAARKENRVEVFLPYYKKIKEKKLPLKKMAEFYTPLAWRQQYTGIYLLEGENRVRYYFVDNEYYFGRDAVYGEGDDGERFAFFSRAVLEALCQLGRRADVIHCNDWQTGALPAFYRAFYRERLPGVKTVFTIHNIEYQGLAHPYFLGDVLGLGAEYEGLLSFDGQINLLKGAIVLADRVNTVSKTYADQLRDPYFAHGMDGIISDYSHKFSGIVNGIDQGVNDPLSDVHLEMNYSADQAEKGKRRNKLALQKEMNLPQRDRVPLFGMVSRLVSHKGTELICPLMEELSQWDLQLVILGTGDEKTQEYLARCAERYPEKFSVNLRFDPRTASRIYAASDFYLMPSRSEPCGLSQLIAMRYGSVPIVHATGGLRDTVIPFDHTTGKGVGITFQSFEKDDFLDAIRRAMTLYFEDGEGFSRLRKNAMEKDSSWDLAAGEYLELYRSLVEKEWKRNDAHIVKRKEQKLNQ